MNEKQKDYLKLVGIETLVTLGIVGLIAINFYVAYLFSTLSTMTFEEKFGITFVGGVLLMILELILFSFIKKYVELGKE